jgi:hypothetical protein
LFSALSQLQAQLAISRHAENSLQEAIKQQKKKGRKGKPLLTREPDNGQAQIFSAPELRKAKAHLDTLDAEKDAEV